MIIPLDSPAAKLDNVGGKGINLARLARAGYPVPGGFLITTEAYRVYVEANQLGSWIKKQLENLDPSVPSELEAASKAIREKFSHGTIPVIIEAAIHKAYEAYKNIPVAVRSSATAEDLPDMSFAGQQDTYLNVIGPSPIRRAIVNCWSSLWTARAIGYRARNGISNEDVALSVVVQEMVQSESSGVLFTANPLNGIRHQIVVDATLGLGEALVAGHVEPDHYIVDTRQMEIIEKSLGDKKVAIRSIEGGGVETLEEEAENKQAIPDEIILELAELCTKVQDDYQSPQDLEWAWADGKLYLLQSRPITSLYPLPDDVPVEPLHVLFSFGAVQGLLEPMTPLGQDTIRMIFAGGAELIGFEKLTHETQGVIKMAGERLWGNITPVFRNSLGKKLYPRIAGVIDPGSAAAITKIMADPRLTPEKNGTSFETRRRMFNYARKNLPEILKNWRHPDERRAMLIKQNERHLQKLAAKSRAIEGTLWEKFAQRVEFYKEIRDAFPVAMPTLGLGAMSGLIFLAILQRLASHTEEVIDGIPRSDLILEITRGLPHNVTTEMDLKLWATAKTIQNNPEANEVFEQTSPEKLSDLYHNQRLPKGLQEPLRKFFEEFGMRGLGEIDFGRPRWRDQPTQIMQTLKSYFSIKEEEYAPSAVFSRGAAASEVATEKLIGAIRRTRGGWLKAKVAKFGVIRLRAFAGLRESPKFHIIQMMGILREALLSSGRDLVKNGILERSEDLFFLYFNELEVLSQRVSDSAGSEEFGWGDRYGDEYINLKSLIRARREVYDREKLRKQIPRLMLSDGESFFEGIREPAGEETEGVLYGSPVSPGVVEGKVHVIHDPAGAMLEHGEILVCPGTDPAWTPLFLAAGGLLMEVGGMMTHGSVVAREYGIPAVVGINAVTTKLKTGMLIRVNGSTGKIEILEA